MLSVIKAVEDGEKIVTAARSYGIPQISLHNRVSGKVIHGTKLGPKPYLTKEEEIEFSEFLLTVSEHGYGRTRRQVKNCVRYL